MDAAHLPGLADAVGVYAEITVGLGEYLAGAALVLPDDEHFPDAVDASPEGVRTLFERVLTYTPVSGSTRFALQFLAPDDEDAGGGCSTGACAPKAGSGAPWLLAREPLAADASDTWHLTVHAQDVRNPVRLMSQLSRLAGDLLLAQAGLAADSDPFERAVRAEVAAVACGLGSLLLAASHMAVKGCGGGRIYEGTALPTHALAGLTVLFAERHGEQASLRRAMGLLQVTAREALHEARAFFGKRPAFVEQLRITPEAVAFHCDFGAEAGLLQRLFGGASRSPTALRA